MEEIKDRAVRELKKIYDESLKDEQGSDKERVKYTKKYNPGDIKRPKDWKQFVDALDLKGVLKLLMESTSILCWEFPSIFLTLEAHQQVFLSEDRKEEVRKIFVQFFETESIQLGICLSGKQTQKENMVYTVANFVDLKKNQSGHYVGLCPFHDELTPSFMVDWNKQIYHCFGCGAHGEDFLRDYREHLKEHKLFLLKVMESFLKDVEECEDTLDYIYAIDPKLKNE
jgi:hypothetical protein